MYLLNGNWKYFSWIMDRRSVRFCVCVSVCVLFIFYWHFFCNHDCGIIFVNFYLRKVFVCFVCLFFLLLLRTYRVLLQSSNLRDLIFNRQYYLISSPPPKKKPSCWGDRNKDNTVRCRHRNRLSTNMKQVIIDWMAWENGGNIINSTADCWLFTLHLASLCTLKVKETKYIRK